MKKVPFAFLALGVTMVLSMLVALSPAVEHSSASRRDSAPPVEVAQDQRVSAAEPRLQPVRAPTSTHVSTPRVSTTPAVPARLERSQPTGIANPAAEELRHLVSVWGLEAQDAAWTYGAHDYITSALEDAHVPLDRLLSTDCRQSVCRAEIRFASQEEAAQVYDLRHPDYDLQFFPDGLTYTVFVAREGKKLADVGHP